MSSRASLIAYLEPILAGTPALDGIKLVKSVRAVDQLRKPVLVVKTDRLEKLPEAPLSHVQAFFTLALVSPKTDPEKAEDELDDLLEALLPALMTSGVMWESATQTSWDDQHVAYDIVIRSILS